MVAALHQEVGPILSWSGWKRVDLGGSSLYRLHIRDLEVILCIGGMGERNSRKAAKLLLESFEVAQILSLGFGGALDKGLSTGEVVWGRRVSLWDDSLGLVPGPEPFFRPQGSLKGAHFLTAKVFVAKEVVVKALDQDRGPFVLDLESYFVGQEAWRKGVGFSCIRAISDECDLDVGPKVTRWINSEFTIKAYRVLASLFSSPKDIRLLVSLYRNSKLASRALERALRDFLQKEFNWV